MENGGEDREYTVPLSLYISDIIDDVAEYAMWAQMNVEAYYYLMHAFTMCMCWSK